MRRFARRFQSSVYQAVEVSLAVRSRINDPGRHILTCMGRQKMPHFLTGSVKGGANEQRRSVIECATVRSRECDDLGHIALPSLCIRE